MVIPEYIEIKNSSGQTVAFLSPESDGLKECYIDTRINGESTLEFQLPANSEKFSAIVPDCQIHAGGRIYTILKDDAIDVVRDENDKCWAKVMAVETWYLLDTVFPEPYITNDPNTPIPADLAIIIVGGGSDLSGGRYTVGSAGHALYALLQGTGWSVGTVDVTGTHDLETEKESTLQNIKKVQEIWGGLLVWDSANKTVSLRDENSWQEYSGFQIRYAKNLKHITRTSNNALVTKLYPFGADNLDIASVNGGKKYLANNTFTNNVYTGIKEYPDIYDAQELKEKAAKDLEKLCRPRYLYQAKIVDLRTLPEYNHEDFALGEFADVIDTDIGINIHARIIRHRYNVFMPWKCEIEIGDAAERLEEKLKSSFDVSDFVNRIITSKGQISAFRLVDESIVSKKIANAAVEASKFNAKIIILTGDVWTNNSPAAGRISWNSHKLYFNGTEYSISSGSTNLKYIYWVNGSTSYLASNTLPTLGDGDFIIAVNNNGVHDIAWYSRIARQFIGSAFIADAAIKTAHIEDLAVTDAKIASLMADKIIANSLHILDIGEGGITIQGGLPDNQIASADRWDKKPIVIDDATTAYFPFDGSIDSSRGLKPTFARNSVAYLSDGTEVAANVPRLEPSQMVFGKAILVEENTTNLIPIADWNTLNGWVSAWATQTRTIETTGLLFNGVNILKSVIEDTVQGIAAYKDFAVVTTPGVVYTISAYVKSQGRSIRIWCHDRSNNGQVYSSYNVPGTDFTRLTVKFTTTDTGYCRVHFLFSSGNIGDIVWVTAPQLEQKPYATSFIDSTRSPETLTIPGDVLNPQEGTVECWVYVNDILKDSIVSARHIIDARGSGNNALILYHDHVTRNFRFRLRNYSGIQKDLDIPDSVVTNGWHFFSIKWSQTNMTLCIDNNVQFAENPPLPSDLSTCAICSYPPVPTTTINSLIDDLRISSKARTDEEILEYYNSKLPFLDVYAANQAVKQDVLYNKVKITSDNGIQVFDALDRERVQIGNYAPDKYGIEIKNAVGDTTVLDQDGIIQCWGDSIVDNVDATHKLKLKFYIPTNVLSVKKVLLNFSLEPFRAYETGAASGGGSSPTTSSGGSSNPTTSNGGSSTVTSQGGSDHRHRMFDCYNSTPWDTGMSTRAYYSGSQTTSNGRKVNLQTDSYEDLYTSYEEETHTHQVNLPNHNHTVTIPNHTHEVTIPAHTHDIVYGIYESTSATGVKVYVDGTLRLDNGGAGYSTDQANLDLTQWIATSGWHTIELSSTQLGRINAAYFIQVFLGV